MQAHWEGKPRSNNSSKLASLPEGYLVDPQQAPDDDDSLEFEEVLVEEQMLMMIASDHC